MSLDIFVDSFSETCSEIKFNNAEFRKILIQVFSLPVCALFIMNKCNDGDCRNTATAKDEFRCQAHFVAKNLINLLCLQKLNTMRERDSDSLFLTQISPLKFYYQKLVHGIR